MILENYHATIQGKSTMEITSNTTATKYISSMVTRADGDFEIYANDHNNKTSYPTHILIPLITDQKILS